MFNYIDGRIDRGDSGRFIRTRVRLLSIDQPD